MNLPNALTLSRIVATPLIFLLPFAASFTGFTISESISMLVFLLLLVEGLVWAYQKKVLVWV